MSFFAVGGNAGFALGPLLVALFCGVLGLAGTPLLALVPVAGALLLLAQLPRLERSRHEPARAALAEGSGDDRWGPFVVVSALATARTGVAFGLLAFIPLAGPAALIVLLVAVGIAMDGNFSTTVTLAQDLLPRRVGLASGVVVGLSVGIGAVVTALLGVLADAAGLPAVLWAIVGLAALSLVLALAVPLGRAPAPALAS